MKIGRQTHRFLIVLVIALTNLGWAHAAAESGAPEKVVLYVKPGSAGACRSWGQACALQTALGLARAGSEIWVAAGEYKPGTNSLDRTATFRLKNGVELYGGFAGTESAQHQRDWIANLTILNGDINNDGELSGNAYHVVSASGLTKPVELDGFVITGGNADADPLVEIWGGGLYVQDSLLTIRNTIFRDNFARLGAGLFIHNGDQQVYMENLLFTQNEALHSGGGFYMENGSNLTMTNVIFSDNTAGLSGGGMANINSRPELINVSFLDNSAGSCGGMANGSLSRPTLTQVTFEGNSADVNGGGMCNSTHTAPTLNRVSFIGNRALNGGGISNYRSILTLTNVELINNSADGIGGGIMNNLGSAVLINTSFWGNSADKGGALHNNSSVVTLKNVTFNNDSVADSSGAISNHVYSALFLKNVILWGNAPDQIFDDPANPSTIVVAYSNIEGGYAGDHNLDADPMFVDAASGDLQVPRTSPVVDAGDNRVIPPEVVIDLAGNPRFVDIPERPNSGMGDPPVDMGAYEAQLPRLYLPLVGK